MVWPLSQEVSVLHLLIIDAVSMEINEPEFTCRNPETCRHLCVCHRAKCSSSSSCFTTRCWFRSDSELTSSVSPPAACLDYCSRWKQKPEPRPNADKCIGSYLRISSALTLWEQDWGLLSSTGLQTYPELSAGIQGSVLLQQSTVNTALRAAL